MWFKGRQFTAEVILRAVRWCLPFPISYRDLELMLADRGVMVDHTTVRKGRVRGIGGRDMRVQAGFVAALFQVAA